MISITESWLDNSVSDAEINIENYSVVRRDRNRNGGGVCVYTRNDFTFSLRSALQTDSDEIFFIELLLPKTKPILIGTVYRPPKQTDFLNKFEILTHMNSDCEIIILGDFNICYLQRSSNIFKSYNNVLKLFDLDQIITEPTRITNTTTSLLDHILCDNKEKICKSGTISVGLSDPFLTYCTRKISKGQINKHKYVKVRSLKNYTKEDFIFSLTGADWGLCFNAQDVNTAWSAFRDIFISVLNSIAPVKEVRLKQRTEPWIDLEILDLIKQRDNCLHLFKKSKSNSYYTLFCQLRNKVRRKIKFAKSEYFSNKMEENKKSPRKLWQQLKNLGYNNNKSESSNIVLKIDGEICHEQKTVANYFNDFFFFLQQLLQNLYRNFL